MRNNQFKKLIPWGRCTVSELGAGHSDRRNYGCTHGLSQFGIQSGMEEYVVYGTLEEIVEYVTVNKLNAVLDVPKDRMGAALAEWEKIKNNLPDPLTKRFRYENFD